MYYYLQAACEGEDWFNLIAIAGVRVYMGICGVSVGSYEECSGGKVLRDIV